MIKKLVVITLLTTGGILSQINDPNFVYPLGLVLGFMGGWLLSAWFEEKSK